jgi:hypothetical protein
MLHPQRKTQIRPDAVRTERLEKRRKLVAGGKILLNSDAPLICLLKLSVRGEGKACPSLSREILLTVKR